MRTRFRFRIGDVFPADDVVARFVVTLAMYANDIFRMQGLRPDDAADNPGALGRRLMLLRFQGSLLYEAMEFIDEAIGRFPQVREFVASLPDEASQAPERLDALLAGVRQSLAGLRNITFHYPEMHPKKIAAGQDELMLALAAVGTRESEIVAAEGETPGVWGAGFIFADVVIGHWFVEFGATTEPLGEAVLLMGGFALAAGRAQLLRQGEGAVLAIEGD
jgi:hypothetical protein